MKTSLGRIVAVTMGAVVLVVGYDAATYATTGHSMIIGKLNKGTTVTTIQRTHAGPALSLKTKAGSAPMTVSSSTKVGHLNADLLDGLHASSLQTHASVFSDDAGGPRGTSETWTFPLAAGTYLLSYESSFEFTTAPTIAAPASARCFVEVGSTFGAASSLVSVGQFPDNFLSATGTFTVQPGEVPMLNCQTSSAYAINTAVPVQVVATKVDSLSNGNLTDGDPGARRPARQPIG